MPKAWAREDEVQWLRDVCVPQRRRWPEPPKKFSCRLPEPGRQAAATAAAAGEDAMEAQEVPQAEVEAALPDAGAAPPPYGAAGPRRSERQYSAAIRATAELPASCSGLDGAQQLPRDGGRSGGSFE
eukprot:CAMPEP_0170257942 /NCGR_PEP_ID=MMETSP0116_2-20130129/28836_1 /TAXON_ID=400756 /ORGANISM="Durinskia baltica, Strain CSIRO CS-38" /LENGTH=126 /DNA_ID=CAMNT_0010508975 /DNA_START=145 /DNA_END=522 /DNA_ORIENTATION=+